MKLIKKTLLPLLFLAIVILVWINYPKLNIITGFAAKSTCSCMYEAKRNFTDIQETDNNFSPINLAKVKVDSLHKKVTATVFGLKKRTAVYINGVGCVLLPKAIEKNYFISFKPNRDTIKKPLPYPYGSLPQKDTLFAEVDYNLLNKAVKNAFVDSLKTRAVLVIYKDQIIAEKYAKGFSQNTKLLGWSITKSIASAVTGILTQKNQISLNTNHLFKEWQKDQRANITLNNLLQMNSGLDWEEDYTKISDVTKMLFLSKDMAVVPMQKTLAGKPNHSWNYSSGTTNLISKYIRNQFTNHQEYLDFWYKELIDKIGMHSMTLETDVEGNYIASSYAWATARDWAKFALLYLHQGNWNKQQIIPKQWVAYSTTPTPTSNGRYGAQFWLNQNSFYPNAPKTMFSCEGYQGQYLFIIPSKNMVIVRFGLAEEPIFNPNLFLKNILKSVA